MDNQTKAFEKLSKLKVGALFMEMGTGKTKVALDLIVSKRHKIDYALWICPYSIKNEIESERLKWHPELILDVVGCESIGSSGRIYLDVLNKMKGKKAFVVVDESLKIKNREAQRTQRILKIGECAEYKLILNGTPISKNYCDLWAQMEFLSPKILQMSFPRFFNTYCSYYTRGKYKGQIRKFVNIPHLIDKISPYVFDAALEIDTQKNYQKIYYSTNHADYARYKEMLFKEYYDSICDDFNFNALAIKLQKWYVENSDRNAVLDDLIKQIDGGVIVFVRFLTSIPPHVHRITGSENAAQRKETISAFQRAEFKVLYITYGCGSFGLNLQFCKNMIFAEHTWDYAVREQAEARIYRIGQGFEVNYFDMICADVGLEDLIFRCITKKADMLDVMKREIQNLKGNVKDFAKFI